MLNSLRAVYVDNNPKLKMDEIIDYIHRNGPDSNELLQQISLYKEFSPDSFAESEEYLISAMGLFYKVGDAESIYSLIMKSIGGANTTASGDILTPVQASVRNAIIANQYISISAPTSAGKSYAIRDYLIETKGDAVIVVPSRALIAEYVSSLRAQFADRRDVMIMPFVDRVFTDRVRRRVFILTPERARQIASLKKSLDVNLFFFDEAHVSEEEGRGVVFDILVRRVVREFPAAKLVFAHPFVENPSAQLNKHGISTESSYSRAYSQGAVGKVFVYRHDNGCDYYFSPFEEKGYLQKNAVKFNGDFAEFALDSKRTLLAYVSKASIYNGTFLDSFRATIRNFTPLTDPKAKAIIEDVRRLIGADGGGQRSSMVELMKIGVVIHHGSVPLEVRFLIEKFIRLKYARICFATSTLAQGINMPFDVVWLETMRLSDATSEKRSLSFKNLIGRAGRLTREKKFDYGYVYTKRPILLSERLLDTYELSPVSVLDADEADVSSDDWEIVKAVKDETYDDEMHMPESRKCRLESDSALVALASVLDTIYPSGVSGLEHLRGIAGRRAREGLKTDLRIIYEIYLGRPLKAGESAVFHEAISILSQVFAGRSFKEIAGTRFSRISRRDELDRTDAQFSQMAATLPNVEMEKPFPVFKGSKEKLPYDTIVFDTYDYLDKVVSFCLVDTFSAAAEIFYEKKGDRRALKLIEMFRFGTNDHVSILLMRYGFQPEIVDELKLLVKRIDEAGITFKPEVRRARQVIRDAVDWYI